MVTIKSFARKNSTSVKLTLADLDIKNASTEEKDALTAYFKDHHALVVKHFDVDPAPTGATLNVFVNSEDFLTGYLEDSKFVALTRSKDLTKEQTQDFKKAVGQAAMNDLLKLMGIKAE